VNSMNAGLWPTVAAPASEARTLAHRIAIAQATAKAEPQWLAEADRRVERLLKAARRQHGRFNRALA
jgi:hypothetical protein